MDELKKVRPGDRLQIPAMAYNAFCDAAADFKRRKSDDNTPVGGSFFQNGIIPIQNTTGVFQDRFKILGVDVPIFTPTDNLNEFCNRFSLKGVLPVATTHVGRFAILAEPADTNAVAMAFLAGVCPVQVNVTDATHNFAEVTPTNTSSLTSGVTGSATILWKETGTGLKWAVVRLGQSSPVATSVNPAVILPAAFETEATQTDTWAITSPPAGTDGVQVRLQTRTAYNEVGDKTLYAFYRDCVFDSRGCLKSVSAETRVAVDTPEDC